MTESMQSWWNPEYKHKKLIDDAYAIWQDVSPKARQIGYWFIHPTTFETLAPASSHEFDTTAGATLFGRPIFISSYIPIGAFYFETEPEDHPPVFAWNEGVTINTIVTVAPSNFTQIKSSFDTMGNAFKKLEQDIAGIVSFPLSVPLWSETPEPDWLVAMAVEMAEERG